MKKLMEMIKRNTVLKVFSVILAFLLWAYVQIAQNPEISYEVVEVPVTVTGEADINSEGFIVSSLPKNMKTNVTVSATRSKIHLLDTTDLFAFVDVSQCHDTGDFNLPVKVRSNDSEITVMNKSPSSVSLYIDEIVTVSKPVTVSYDGTLDTDYYIDKDNIKLTPENISLKVPELLSTKIASVLVSVDMTGVKSSVNANYKGIAVDEKGEEVFSDNLTFVTESINVQIPILKKKIVPVKIENAPEGVSFTLSKENIEVAGNENQVETLTSIAGYINDYNPDENKTSYSVTLKLPDGFTLIDSEEITAYPIKAENSDTNAEQKEN